jgi:toxin-antitoxin system PIN domain toxin
MSMSGERRRPYLLDTNVLIALAWPNHVHHVEALNWFRKKGSAAFRTCPTTQLGFVRISSNPAFSPAAVAPPQALELLARITQLPGHAFWPDDLTAGQAFEDQRALIGHREVSDGYLIALAQKHGGVMATLDRGTTALASSNREALELIFDRL